MSGQGLNCFLFSLLQHVTGNYAKQNCGEEDVRRIKTHAGLEADLLEMNYGDTTNSLKLIGAVNALFKANFQVFMVVINFQGDFFLLDTASGDVTKEVQPVVVWLQVGHFVALTSKALYDTNDWKTKEHSANVHSEDQKLPTDSIAIARVSELVSGSQPLTPVPFQLTVSLPSQAVFRLQEAPNSSVHHNLALLSLDPSSTPSDLPTQIVTMKVSQSTAVVPQSDCATMLQSADALVNKLDSDAMVPQPVAVPIPKSN